MKKQLLLILFAVIGLSVSVKAQKGNNELQVAAQLAIPTGDLGTLANLGYGASAKALFGFGSARQQVSFEAGYNRWTVKSKYLAGNENAEYRSFPIYTGYRYILGSVYLESQAGVAFNTIYASNFFNLKGETKAYFAWAAGVGYSIKSLDIALRYQSSEVKNSSSDINFVALRVGYRFPFNKNRITQ